MREVIFALLFMALGGAIVNVSWLHSWKMYKNGKVEGQSGAIRNNHECRRAQK